MWANNADKKIILGADTDILGELAQAWAQFWLKTSLSRASKFGCYLPFKWLDLQKRKEMKWNISGSRSDSGVLVGRGFRFS